MCPWKVPTLDFPQKFKNQLLQLVITAVDVSMSTITTGQPSAKCEMNSFLLKANKKYGMVYALQTADISNYRCNSDRVWWISHGHDFYFICLLLLFLFFVRFFCCCWNHTPNPWSFIIQQVNLFAFASAQFLRLVIFKLPLKMPSSVAPWILNEPNDILVTYITGAAPLRVIHNYLHNITDYSEQN